MNKAYRNVTANRGFTLIVTIAMLVVLTVIAVGLLSLSSVTLKSSSISSAEERARANARMALKIAIGQLQETMGPDKRISARGLTLAQHPNFGGDIEITTNSPRAWWVGAASSDTSETIWNNQPVVWLVSGLNPSASAEAQIQISSPFIRPITMYGENSIDLTLTGGRPITAGAVSIVDEKDSETVTGAYAYFIDDNGMKAQLTTSHPDLVNNDSSEDRPGGTVIPGSYDLSILNEMGAFAGKTAADYSKMFSVNDLPLLGGDRQISKNKRLSYTTHSLGVLSDVKEGGLKKDLTIAFENYEIDGSAAYHPEGGDYPNWPVYEVFENTLGKDYNASARSSDNPSRDDDWGGYLVVDESKRSEFGANGYIHWGMFRDYYNLKRYIRRATNANKAANGTMEYLDPIVVHNTILSSMGGDKPFGNGKLPPHEMGPDSGFGIGSGRKEGLPYGNYRTWPNMGNRRDKEFPEYYKHSPVMPIMSKMQMNVWLERGVVAPEGDPDHDPAVVDAIETNYQFFTSMYNPYNIGLRCWDPNQSRSFSCGNLPYAVFYLDEDDVDFKPVNQYTYNYQGWDSIRSETGTLQARSYGSRSAPLYLSPGRALALGITKDVEAGRIVLDRAFDYNFVDSIDSNVFKNFPTYNPVPATLDTEVHIAPVVNMYFGVQQQGAGGGYSTCQTHFNAFAREPVKMGHWSNTAGINIDVPPAGLGFNTMASLVYRLRSTTETDNSAIRPLIDANIRGFFFNPRWDSPLNMETSAAYILDDEIDQGNQVPQMLTATDGEGTEIGFTYWGNDDTTDGYDRVILFDIPRQDLVSIGQLQHANAGRFSYEPSYIVGNSYANPRISQNSWKDSISDTYASAARGYGNNGPISGSFDIYDASYLVNETIWDSFIFTTIPQVADNYNDPEEPEVNEELFENLLNREEHLPNPRFIPYQPTGSSFDMSTLQRVGDDVNLSAFHYNAGHLLVDGAFNVNSTSVDAWEAFLSGTYGMPYQKMDATGAITGFETVEDKIRFPRLQTVLGDPFNASSPDEGYWTGFPALTPEEIREIAVEIVDQIEERGPFLTLGEFVNRKLETGDLGEKGALQAALDKTVNDSPSTFYSQTTNHSSIPNGENQAAGFPGQLLQGDILQALSPFMTVRSDNFTIRAYGEALNPSTGEVEAKAWCEAVVQRYPDPVAPDPEKSYLEELSMPSSPSGRVFKMTRFRWLNANEV